MENAPMLNRKTKQSVCVSCRITIGDRVRKIHCGKPHTEEEKLHVDDKGRMIVKRCASSPEQMVSDRKKQP
jgi:hypothetical protein